MPDWLPPFLVAVSMISVLNLALLVQRLRARRGAWDKELRRQLRAWDGRVPQELDRRPT